MKAGHPTENVLARGRDHARALTTVTTEAMRTNGMAVTEIRGMIVLAAGKDIEMDTTNKIDTTDEIDTTVLLVHAQDLGQDRQIFLYIVIIRMIVETGVAGMIPIIERKNDQGTIPETATTGRNTGEIAAVMSSEDSVKVIAIETHNEGTSTDGTGRARLRQFARLGSVQALHAFTKWLDHPKRLPLRPLNHNACHPARHHQSISMHFVLCLRPLACPMVMRIHMLVQFALASR